MMEDILIYIMTVLLIAACIAIMVYLFRGDRYAFSYKGEQFKFASREHFEKFIEEFAGSLIKKGYVAGFGEGWERGVDSAREKLLEAIGESGEVGEMVRRCVELGREMGFSAAMESVKEVDFDSLLGKNDKQEK